MVNKKGVIKIVEAVIAVLIILTVVIVIAQRKSSSAQGDLTDRINPILQEIAGNVTLREHILNSPNDAATKEEIMNFLSTRIISKTIGYNITICDPKEICPLVPFPSDANNLYSGERIISSVLESPTFQPKKIKLFLWVRT